MFIRAMSGSGGGGSAEVKEAFSAIKLTSNSQASCFGSAAYNIGTYDFTHTGEYMDVVWNANAKTITAVKDCKATVIDQSRNVTTSDYSANDTLLTVNFNTWTTGKMVGVYILD